MDSLFFKRRLVVSILGLLPIISHSRLLTKEHTNDSKFIDYLLRNLPYSRSHKQIGRFIILHSQTSKVLISKLTELQSKLHHDYVSQNKEQLCKSINLLIKNDFLNYKTLSVKGLVISETEATLWALQFINSKN